jgi:Ig-like domain from next to BRCA1 gene
MRRRNRRRRSGTNTAVLQREPSSEPAKARAQDVTKGTLIFVAMIGAAATIAAAVIGLLPSGNTNHVHTTGSTTMVSTPSSVTASPPNSPSDIGMTLVPGDNSSFIRDVTYPDGSEVITGQHFIKKWEIKNTGTIRWVGRYLAAMGESTGSCTYPSRVPVPTTNPGQTVVISVPVTAASFSEVCFVTWKMVTGSDIEYFPGFVGMWFDVKVVENSHD